MCRKHPWSRLHLCKYYTSGEAEVRALDGVDLSIERGEYLRS